MDTTMIKVPSFEGHNLNPINFAGQPVWIATQIEEILGYTPKGLISTISRNWSDEMVEGIHYHIIKGQDLRDLKAVLGELVDDLSTSSKLTVSHTVSLKHTRNLMLLTQAGLDMVCIKTDKKPVGPNLRKWLVEEVMATLRQTGTYSLAHKPTPPSPPSPALNPADPRVLREQRLAAREQRLAAKQKADGIERALDHIKALLPGQVTPETEAILRVKAAQIRTGEQLPALLPQVTHVAAKRAGEIADLFGVHVNSINAAVRALGLKGTDHCEERQELIEIQKPGDDGQVATIQKAQTVYLYDETAVDQIHKELVEKGKITPSN